VKAEAERRLAVLDAVAVQEAAGVTRTAAVASVSARYGASAATIWNWFALIAGVAHGDRLPHLAPRRSGGGKEIAICPEIFQHIASDYLRNSKPGWASCYDRLTRDYCKPRGITPPNARTLWRKFERDIDPLVVISMRDGAEALANTIPPQIRDVSHLAAMEWVNVDGHKWDVFVRWPDGRIIRPMMVAIQDVHSGKFLGWRLDESENAIATRLAFADVFRDHGIPGTVLMDNSRAFSSKIVTGGFRGKRFRYKYRENEPLGFLPALGVEIKFATPYHGQAKPIERMFRNMCESIAKHPAFEGAYTGPNPMAKPENYGNAAIPLDRFIEVLKREITAYNAALGRRGEIMKDLPADQRSFDQVFDASYANSAIRKATPEQMRYALLETANSILLNKKHGSIKLHGNLYWSEPLSRLAGERVTVRFDPDRLHTEVHVYSLEDKFICSAPLWEKSGFDNTEAAAVTARRNRDWKRKTKEAQAAYDLLSATELAAAYGATEPQEPAVHEAKIVRPLRTRGSAALKLAPEAFETPLSNPSDPQKPAVIDRLAAIAERQLRIV
jgi:putative transposase